MPLSTAELVEVKKVFARYDTAGTGLIDAEAVTAAARGLNVAGSPVKHVEGKINFEQFCKVSLEVPVQIGNDRIRCRSSPGAAHETNEVGAAFWASAFRVCRATAVTVVGFLYFLLV